MKNKLFYFVLIVLVSGVLLLAGCATPTHAGLSHTNWGAFGEATLMPVKDFEVVGHVFTSTTLRIDNQGGISGTAFSYQALLREADALGAHAIINVTIDRQVNIIGRGRSMVREEIWRGSALAIRYTDILTNQLSVLNEPNIHGHTGGGSVVVEEEQPRRRWLGWVIGGVAGIAGVMALLSIF